MQDYWITDWHDIAVAMLFTAGMIFAVTILFYAVEMISISPRIF